MKHPFQPSDFTSEGYLLPQAYQRWFQARQGKPPRAAALILAGGQSSRMGRDKALLTLEGETLLERSVRFWRTSGRVERIYVAVGRPGHLADCLPEGVIPVWDSQLGQGPMAGLVAGFLAGEEELLYLSAVDMPHLRREALLPIPPGDGAVYRCRGRLEPMLGVYRRSLLPAAQALLERGEGRMATLLEQGDTLYVDTQDETLFQNLNTPEELLLARAGTPPILAITGYSGSGKTTFLEGLLPCLRGRGLRVGVLKHDGHGFRMDTPGKDTYRLATAGGDPVGILSPRGWAVLGYSPSEVARLRPLFDGVDLILAEGFKTGWMPKLEVHRAATGKPLAITDDSLVALITDETMPVSVPQLALEDYQGCARLICRLLGR